MINRDLILNFTGVYDEMIFHEKADFEMLDCRKISGTAMYVDADGEDAIRKKIAPYGPGGIHFIDNGNYHYVTRFFLEKIEGPFDLLVFDHHHDDQEPMIAGLRSCGSWIRDMKEDLGDKVNSVTLCLGVNEIERTGRPDPSLPLYISIDKDVLSADVVKTNWDQGNMTLPEMMDILKSEMKDRKIAGVDICGECAEKDSMFNPAEVSSNEAADKALADFFFQKLRGEKVAKKRKKKKKTALGVFFGVFFRLFAIITVVTCILGGIFLWYFYDHYIKEYDKEAKELVDNSTRNDFKRVEPTYIYDVDGNVIMKLREEGDAAYLSYEDIPQYAVNAFIAVEDRTFWKNPGYDLGGIARVLFYYIRTKGVEKHGASTITQQLAKNVYLSSEVSITRKLREILISRYLAEKYSKQDIMEFYVNNIYFANQYYGLEAAAQGYFGKHAASLSLSEVAYLCAIPNRPAYYDPVKYPDHALTRRDKILGDMLEEGLISQSQYDQAVSESINIMESSGSELKDYQATYAMDCAVRYLMKLSGFSFQYTYADSTEYENYESLYNEMYEEQKELLYSGGYKIYTTLNSVYQDDLQEALDEVLSFDTEVTESSGAYALQGAVTAVDNSNGKVIAIVGGRTNPGGASNNLTLNRAFQSFRQPGSSIKPLIVYAPALENGYYPGSIVQNIDVTTAKKKGVNALTLSGTPMTLRSAVENSINGCAWQVLANISPKTGIKHITDMEYRKIVPDDYNLAASLGGLTNGVTTAEQAAGYSALANHGSYRGQTCISSIKNSDGEEIYVDSDPVQVYTSQAADTMIDIMKGVVTNGTAKKMGWYTEQTTEAAGKTGTTNGSKDGWFCGVTPYYSVAVWVGYDTPRELASLYGSSYPASIWKQCMSALIDGESTASFYLPDKMEEASSNAEKYLPGRDASEELYAGYTVGDYRNDHNIGDAVSAVLAQMGALSRLTDPNYDADIAALYSQCAASIAGVKDASYAAELQSQINTAYAVAAAKVN